MERPTYGQAAGIKESANIVSEHPICPSICPICLFCFFATSHFFVFSIFYQIPREKPPEGGFCQTYGAMPCGYCALRGLYLICYLLLRAATRSGLEASIRITNRASGNPRNIRITRSEVRGQGHIHCSTTRAYSCCTGGGNNTSS